MQRTTALAFLFTLACGAAPIDPTVPPAGADFGDAPDTTYPTRLANNGARAIDVDKVALAAAPNQDMISLELDADDLNDPDGEPNDIRGALPQPDDTNRDDFDNGIVRSSLDLTDPTAPRLAITVGALLKDADASGTYYLNVVFDEDVDGTWNDEWTVQNAEVVLTDVGALKETDFFIPLAGAIQSGARSNVVTLPYMRLVLSDQPITTPTWNGEGAFAIGEVEDWAIAGFDDPPVLACDAPNDDAADFVFDFAGRSELPLPCTVARPAFANAATQIDFFHDFRQTIPGGTDVVVQCTPNPTPGLTRAAPNQATSMNPLPLVCVAENVGNVRINTPIVAADLSTDLDGAVFAKDGQDSTVVLEISFARSFLRFVDTAAPEVRVCEGLTGSYDQINGGLVVQLTRDRTDCTMIANDGVVDGTFVVSGGTGFRGRGEMFIAPLVGDNVFLPGGGIVAGTFNGQPLAGPAFDVPVDRDSMNVLDVTFSSGLRFEIAIDIVFVPDGQNIVTQTIRSSRVVGP